MRKAFCLNFLIFCTVWSQAIAVISNENIEKSSDHHMRKKRVINKSPGGAQQAHVTLARHIVQIVKHGIFECAGNILETNIILVPRNCLHEGLISYSVLSGSLTKLNGTSHRVVKRVNHPTSNLALLLIYPSISLNPHGNEKIKIFNGVLPPHSAGLFSGWGCTELSSTGQHTYPNRLMAVLLPIITHQECYRAIITSHLQIPSTDILCTLDPSGERGACYGDEGGSLVYGGLLLGIYSHIERVIPGVYPDVFVNLSNNMIAEWIAMKIDEIQQIGATLLGNLLKE